MARFFGLVQGGRGKATRLGHTSSGMDTIAASHSGAVRVRLYDQNGVDMAEVRFTPWGNKGMDRVLYVGPVEKYEPRKGINVPIKWQEAS